MVIYGFLDLKNIYLDPKIIKNGHIEAKVGNFWYSRMHVAAILIIRV